MKFLRLQAQEQAQEQKLKQANAKIEGLSLINQRLMTRLDSEGERYSKNNATIERLHKKIADLQVKIRELETRNQVAETPVI